MLARTTEASCYHDGTVFKGIAIVPHVGAAPSKVRYVVIAPHMSSRVDFGAHNNNLPNLCRALNERVFNVQSPQGLVPTPLPHPGVWQKLSPVARRLASRITKFGMVEPLTSQEFVEQSPSNKRALYAEAAKELRQLGWGKRHARIKAFVKFEKLNFTKKKDPAPRVIQPRNPVYNIALGRFTRRIEHEMYKALAEDWADGERGYTVVEGWEDEAVVMKGLTVEETAKQLRRKWDKFQCPVAIGLDASRFDQHVSADALKWEHSVYNAIFNNKELAALLRLQLNNDGFAYLDGHKLTYTVSGTRASGDMNTSLGNCMIMCCLIREYVSELGIRAELANNGDDCVLFVEKRDMRKLDTLPEWFLRYGFEMEVEPPVFVFEKIVFCQAQPVLANSETNTWVMVRQPEAALGKDAMCLSAKDEHSYRQWAYQVGVGGQALYGDMPVYSELYRSYKRNGLKSKCGQSLLFSDSGFMRMTRQIVRGGEASVVRDETRISFWKAFDILPSIQVMLESRLRRMAYSEIRDYPLNIAPAVGLFTA